MFTLQQQHTGGGFLATLLLHLHCLLFGVLGWVSVQHFVTSADVERASYIHWIDSPAVNGLVRKQVNQCQWSLPVSLVGIVNQYHLMSVTFYHVISLRSIRSTKLETNRVISLTLDVFATCETGSSPQSETEWDRLISSVWDRVRQAQLLSVRQWETGSSPYSKISWDRLISSV